MSGQLQNIDHSVRAHAFLSASGAHRWMACTVSPHMEKGFKDSETSVFAEEGTLAHEFADIGVRYATGSLSEQEYQSQLVELRAHKLYYDGMEEEVDMFIDYVLDQYTAAKSKNSSAILLTEEKVDLSQYIEQGSGTCDDIIISDGVMEVIDLKFGKGVRVSANDNDQLKLYGLGALHKFGLSYDVQTVRLTIVQPRLDFIESWDIPAAELEAWGTDHVIPTAQKAYKGEGEAVAGSHCKFCKAKGVCRAFATASLTAAKAEFDADDLTTTNFDKKDTSKLSKEELIAIYKHANQIQEWIDAISSHMLKSAIDGESYPGYKLVEGRSVRTWANQEKVVETLSPILKSEQYMSEPKLLGITAIEKVLGKPKFKVLLSRHIVKPAGKPTLASADDKRPELRLNCTANDFEEDDDGL